MQPLRCWPVIPEEQLRVWCGVSAFQQSLRGVFLQDRVNLMAPLSHCWLQGVNDALIHIPPEKFHKQTVLECREEANDELTQAFMPFCLPFVSLQRNLLDSVGACRERQQSLALDLSWHHKHIGLEGVKVVSDILRHYLWPFSLVHTIRQQFHHNLEENKFANLMHKVVKQIFGLWHQCKVVQVEVWDLNFKVHPKIKHFSCYLECCSVFRYILAVEVVR